MSAWNGPRCPIAVHTFVYKDFDHAHRGYKRDLVTECRQYISFDCIYIESYFCLGQVISANG